MSFQYLAPHQQPRPFPTRRSSDLAGELVLQALDDRGLRARDAEEQLGELCWRHRRLPVEESGDGSIRCYVRCVVFLSPDRKSIRLNSSHLVISYAVFCLIKKRKEL